MKPYNVRVWRRLTRKVDPAQPADLDVLDLLAGVAGAPEAAQVIYDRIGGDPARLPDVLPYLDTLPGIGAGTAYRFVAAYELMQRAAGAAGAHGDGAA